MRDAEQAIERVLAGLREADAPPGMEGRILRAMEERAAERNSWKPWYVWMKTPGYAGLTAGGVVAALLAVLVMPSMRKAAPVSAEGRMTSVAASPASLASGQANGVPQRLKPQGERGEYGTAEAVPLSKAGLGEAGLGEAGLGKAGLVESGMGEANSDEANSGKAGRSLSEPAIFRGSDGEPSEGFASAQQVRSGEVVLNYDALAVSEMLAPSKPAPRLPLTNQEKLLAKVVRKGEPEALATLRSEVRAKQMEISKAEFQDFFQPTAAKDNE